MNNIFYIILIQFVLILPLIIVYGIQEKKGRVRHILVTFSAPDGSTRQLNTKIGFSWTIFLFKGWALLFRGQFLEFLILFFLGFALSQMSIYSLSGFQEIGSTINFEMLWNNSTTIGKIGFIIFSILEAALSYYYILFGNKIRLRSLYRRGFSFDNGLNTNVSDIYDYIKEKPRTKPEDLKPGQKQGATHAYVVPDSDKQEEDEFDYTNLTIQDMKLLLKSEQVPFSSDDTKEELLKMIEEYISKPAKKEAEIKKNIEAKSKYSKETISTLVEILDKREIKYDNKMKKSQLIELLEEADKK